MDPFVRINFLGAAGVVTGKQIFFYHLNQNPNLQ